MQIITNKRGLTQPRIRALFKKVIALTICFVLSIGPAALVGHVSAATPQAVVGMPFQGQWAWNRLIYPPYTDSNSSHPSVHHTPGGGNWATDVYAGEGQAVKLDVTYATGALSFSWVSSSTSCGQSTKLNIIVDGTPVGWLYFAHLNNAVTSGTITNGMTLGYVHDWGGCNPGVHVHIEFHNTSNYSCYADNGNAGQTLSYGANLGVLGSSNTGPQQACSSIPSGPTSPSTSNLIKNSDFGQGGNSWSRTGGTTNFSVLSNSNGTTPYEGNQYMATNTQDSGGSVYQDVPVNLNSGDTICASTMLTTIGSSSGSSGNITLWVNGNGSSINYNNIPGNNVWTPYKVCNTASSSTTTFRFQVYPAVGSPTVGVDTIVANKDLVKNGDFGAGGNNWSRTGGTTNFSVLSNSGGTTPYEGNQYMATNTQDSGGSVYQDIPMTINTGDTVCARTMLTTYGTGSGSSGNVYLWINGSGSSINYNNIPGNNVWTPYEVCNTATASASTFRFQIYPGVNSPTVGVDTIDVNKGVIKNGDFNLGSNSWSRTGGTTNFSVLSNSSGTTPYEGNQFMATNTQDSGGSVYQDVPLTINSGDSICANLMLTTVGTGSGSSGNISVWINGNSSSIHYSNLPGNNAWTPYKVCNTATGSGSTFRYQIYPDIGSPTVGVDTIDEGM